MKCVLILTNKSELAKAILSYVDGKSEIENIFDEQNPLSKKFVLDGGSLLHRIKWGKGVTYNEIAIKYAEFVINWQQLFLMAI